MLNMKKNYLKTGEKEERKTFKLTLTCIHFFHSRSHSLLIISDDLMNTIKEITFFDGI